MARLSRFRPAEQEALRKWEESCRLHAAAESDDRY
jgi:hypothetical protein